MQFMLIPMSVLNSSNPCRLRVSKETDKTELIRTEPSFSFITTILEKPSCRVVSSFGFDDMDEAQGESVSAKRSNGVDWISNLPESLLCQVLLKLRTKDVVQCSVLSTRWRNLWKCVPRLDLCDEDFYIPLDPDSSYERCVRFVDKFLGFHSDSYLESFRLIFPGTGDREPNNALIRRWMTCIIKLKVKYLEYFEDSYESDEFQIPPSIYTYESLVSLKLSSVTMSSPEFVSLPSLRVVELHKVRFPEDLAIETFISGCKALESLVIQRNWKWNWYDKIQVLRVCSQSLLRFTHIMDSDKELVEDLSLVIDAPKLKYLKLYDYGTASFIIRNPGSLVEVDIDIVFKLCYGRSFDPSDIPKRNMIRNFLGSIHLVKDMITSSTTLEVIYDYSRCEPLPLFSNMSSSRVNITHDSWEMLPIFLESCPNLKSLVLDFNIWLDKGRINNFPGPRSVLLSLQYVKIERPLKGEEMEMNLVRYLLENSKILKKLTLSVRNYRIKSDSVIFKELLAIPRLSTSCQVVVL